LVPRARVGGSLGVRAIDVTAGTHGTHSLGRVGKRGLGADIEEARSLTSVAAAAPAWLCSALGLRLGNGPMGAAH
jgi:hypothetical protein